MRTDNLTDQCCSSVRCLVVGRKTVVPYCDKYCNLGHVFLAYTKAQFTPLEQPPVPRYICFSDSVISKYSLSNNSIKVDGTSCYDPKLLGIQMPTAPHITWDYNIVQPIDDALQPLIPMPEGYYDFCQQPDFYRCLNSPKCIRLDRLLDAVRDCFHNDDEQFETVNNFVEIEGNPLFFECPTTHQYISSRLVDNGKCDWRVIDRTCHDEYSELSYSRTHLSFQTVCDAFTELIPITVDGQSMTDEHWLCNNIYTRCDHIWNCPDGRDEVNCHDPPLLDCPADRRQCLSVDTNNLTCLSDDRVSDGRVDCIGASDEPCLCRFSGETQDLNQFYCENDIESFCTDSFTVCNGHKDCPSNEDERFCRSTNNVNHFLEDSPWDNTSLLKIEKHFNQHFSQVEKWPLTFFSLVDQRTPTQLEITDNVPSPSSLRTSQQPHSSPCHRGLPLRLVSATTHRNENTTICLCPPSLYGHFCQFQKQRIALTLQFHALSDSWQTLFAIAILLVHHDPSATHSTHIHSSQQLTYLPMRDCKDKFHRYLLYAARPLNTSLNHSIHIHLYDKVTFTHRATCQIPVLFPFLPVYRLALLLEIPSTKDDSICSTISCGPHGRCIAYTPHRQTPKTAAAWCCQCDRGWSGRYCTDPKNSSCSSDSSYLGTLINGRSICLCPADEFGDRCLISNGICRETQSDNQSACLNSGRCIPNYDGDVQEKQDLLAPFTCICSKEFIGVRCELRQIKLIFSFDTSSVNVPESMLIHFIRYQPNRRHDNATTIKSIPINQDTVTVHCSQPFHLAFIELNRHQYYLAAMQKTLVSFNETIRKTVS